MRSCGGAARSYLLDLARVFPPEDTHAVDLALHGTASEGGGVGAATRGSIFQRMLRPEFMAHLRELSLSPPLNSGGRLARAVGGAALHFRRAA